MHTEGEPAVARVAERVGIPYALSTMGTTSIERLAAAAPGGAALVPALPVARPRGEPRLRRPGRGVRLRGAGADRRHPGRRAPAARRPQRPDHPAVAVACGPSPRARCTRPGGSTCSPPSRWSSRRCTHFDGTVAELVGRDVRPGRDDGRPRLAAVRLGRAAGRQGHPDAGRRPGRRRRAERTRSSSPTTADASSTGRRPRSRCCPRWSTRSATGPRCTSTAAIMSGSDVVAARGARGAGGAGRPRLPVRPDGRRRARGRSGRPTSSRAEVATTMALLGVREVAGPPRDHVRRRTD